MSNQNPKLSLKHLDRCSKNEWLNSDLTWISLSNTSRKRHNWSCTFILINISNTICKIHITEINSRLGSALALKTSKRERDGSSECLTTTTITPWAKIDRSMVSSTLWMIPRGISSVARMDMVTIFWNLIRPSEQDAQWPTKTHHTMMPYWVHLMISVTCWWATQTMSCTHANLQLKAKTKSSSKKKWSSTRKYRYMVQLISAKTSFAFTSPTSTQVTLKYMNCLINLRRNLTLA